MSTANIATDYSNWLARWDAQQQRHIPDREERFTAMVDAVAAFAGPEPRVLDLGCGPGSLSARVLDRVTGAGVVAIDEIRSSWPSVAGRSERGSSCSSSTLTFAPTGCPPCRRPDHMTPRSRPRRCTGSDFEQLVGLYQALGRVLRPGAVFLDGDRLDFNHDQRVIATGARQVRPEWPDAPEGAEDYDAWWKAVVAEPGLAGEVAERARRWHDHPHEDEGHSYEFHRSALFSAGFVEVGTLWQHLANRVLVAIR